MARISAISRDSIISIRTFLGLNENPDGDTALKDGELSQCRNFRITQDGHLQIRPGTKTILRLGLQDDGALDGAWYGMVGGQSLLLCAWGGTVFHVDLTAQTPTATGLYTIPSSAAGSGASFFGFGGNVYILYGGKYLCWDGTAQSAAEVDGYVPLVQVATTPAGDGTPLENVNRLTNKRRIRFSPDGAANVFHLPEQTITSIAAVTLNGSAVIGYTADLSAGTVQLPTVPAAGTNTLEVTYAKGDGARSEVEGMRFAELYNGSTDTRVFLYGDGTNRAIYSGVAYDSGQPSAAYFPDLFEIAVGEGNTPLTGLVRHYDRMMAYKTDSAWMIRYGSLTLEDGSSTAAFYCQSVNRQFGNDAPGQVRLLENSPVTLEVGGVFRWKSSGYSAYVSTGENNAERISDRVNATLSGFDTAKVRTYNMKRDHEYWLQYGDTALILNYGNNTWYKYEGVPFRLLVEADRQRIGFCEDGRVVSLSRDHFSDDGLPIKCVAATGSMDFRRDWLRKCSPMLFVSLMPETGARVTVKVETDQRSDYPAREISNDLASFSHVSFARYTFFTSRKPQTTRLPIKVKNAAFYKLIFSSDSNQNTATVLEADIRVRAGGFVR